MGARPPPPPSRFVSQREGDHRAEAGVQGIRHRPRPQVVEGMHRSVEQMCPRFLTECKFALYITPTSYLELITTANAVLTKKKNEIIGLKNRYDGGLEMLDRTATQVLRPL